MSETTPEPTTASDLSAGGDKPGGDYGDVSGIGTAADESAGGGSGGGEDGGDGGDRSDAAGTPDSDEAEEAQRGVQAAFESGIEGG